MAWTSLAGMFQPPNPLPPQTTFHYDTYDTTGAVAEPGSYAFLANPADTASAVTTYEGLRDGSATALRIHEADADGVSRAAFLDTVEAGDLFEWHEADDCFVRYKVTEVKPDPTGTVPRRLLAVEWMTFTYTGCSGAISASDNVQIVWGPLPNLGGESLSVPVIHGAYEIVPLDWSGETMRDYVPFPDYSDPVETDDITVARTLDFWREPTIPDGWTFGKAIAAGGDAYGGARWGYCATWWAKDVKIPNTTVVHRQRGVQICADFTSTRYGNQDASWNNGSAVHETRVIAGRPASLRFSPPGPNHRLGFPTLIQVFDPTTGVTYEIEAIDYDLKSNPEAVVEMARSLFEPPNPLPPQTTFRYDTYDTTGAVAEPGSYAFLADPADTASAVTTYEGLRDGTATALRIHGTDADGVSRAAFLDTVEAGDLFEWRQAEDCWIRYQIELTPIAGTGATRDFGIRWITYAPTGCSGGVPATSASTMEWRPPDAIQSPTLTSPVRHGQYLLIPTGWDGPMAPGEKGGDPLRLTGILVEPQVDVAPPPDYRASIDAMSPTERVRVETSDPAEARRLIPLWRDPVLPEGWTLRRAEVGTPDAPFYGYMAQYVDERGYPALLLYVSYPDRRPDYRWVTSASNSTSTYEVRTVDGHAALVRYSPPGPLHNRYKATKVQIFNATTGIDYWLLGQHQSLSGANVDATIEIARSLFESPNPLPSPTTFRYDTYDTTGAVAEPGSYAFLADPADTRSAVTTYEGLRDGSATSLRIHETDAEGVSRAAFLDTVEVGDLFEWRQAEDCWVRYMVTSMAAASGTSTREFGVKSFTDAYAGCSGVVAVEGDRRIDWSPPVISSRALTSPVRHGLYHLIPSSWAGTTAEPVFPPLPDHVAAIRDLPCCDEPHPWWREAEVPEGWTLTGVTWGGETDPTYGYSAWYRNEHGDAGVEILVGYWAREQYPWPFPVWADTALVREPRIIDGHHALVQYSPAGLRHEPRRLPEVWLFNEETRMFYLVIAWDPRLAGSDPTATIAIARSLFEAPNPQ